MQDSQIPPKIPALWANGATSSYITYPVPTPSQQGVTNGAASFTDGFPPDCFIPIASGGAGPFGKDFNGIFKQITADIQWQQAVGIWQYDSAFQSAQGGYPQWALVQSTTTQGRLWLSTADNNTSNPDTGGANWLALGINTSGKAPGGLIATRTFTTSGTYTPTTGTNSADVFVLGGGAAGGGTSTTGSGQFAIGGGGGAGGWAHSLLTSGFSGVTMTIGAGGVGATGANGGNGGTTSFGSLLSATGGTGGAEGPAGTGSTVQAGGLGGAGTGGNIANGVGVQGGTAIGTTESNFASGYGGASYFGSGGAALYTVSQNGVAAPTDGAGGGGGSAAQDVGTTAGGNGGAGVIIVNEYA